ncbi:hypothetical protein [Halobaculum sp. MBLA0143]|uniref:hypothetical protein n=1 Tax=Halobaculum sp. MBLA0143 TaxID=3079933 RepID=UPI003526547D
MAHGADGTTRDWRQTALVVLVALGFTVSFGGAGLAFASGGAGVWLPLLGA